MAKSQQKIYACVYSNRWSSGLLLIIFDKRAGFILQSFCNFSSVARRFLSIVILWVLLLQHMHYSILLLLISLDKNETQSVFKI